MFRPSLTLVPSTFLMWKRGIHLLRTRERKTSNFMLTLLTLGDKKDSVSAC